jgi:polyisoprenoid-binding protein YceI
MKYISLVLLSLLSLTVNAKSLEVVREHSRINFDVDYMVMTTVEGQFRSYYGFFDLSDKEDQISNVRVDITADSIDSNDAKRDFHLKAQEFFFVSEYPTIAFKAPAAVKISEGQKFKLTGEVTIRGITKPLSLEGTYKGKRLDPWGKNNYFFTLTGELNRKDFGMVWNKKMDAGGYLVGDLVRLNITIQSQIVGEKTSFSTHMIPNTKAIQERADLKSGKIKKLTTPTDPNDQSAPKK